MIVHPHFLDHWKLKALAARLGGRLEAIESVLRLWAHCQEAKEWVFDLNAWKLAAICRAPDGMAEKLWEAFTDPEIRILDEAGESAWEVHEWAQENAALTSAWTKARKGGRKSAEKRGLVQAEVEAGLKAKDRIGLDRKDRTNSAAAGRPELSECQAWTEKFNTGQGQTLGMRIEPAWVIDWHDDRSKLGWVTIRGQSEIPIRDWQADLRGYARMRKSTASATRSMDLGQKKEGGRPEKPTVRTVVLNHPRMPEPPCDWRPVLIELYPLTEYPTAQHDLPWGEYDAEIRRDVECECRKRGILSPEWKQPPVPEHLTPAA